MTGVFGLAKRLIFFGGGCFLPPGEAVLAFHLGFMQRKCRVWMGQAEVSVGRKRNEEINCANSERMTKHRGYDMINTTLFKET